MASGGEKYGVPALVIGIGSLLIYAGIKGYSVLQLVQDVVMGKSFANAVASTPLSAGVAEGTVPAQVTEGSGNLNPNVGAGGSGNQVLGQSLAGLYGWGSGSEWDALVKLWNQESGWNNRAMNASSGAYGIPQALPYSKMPKAAWPESGGGTSDPTAQIKWGLDYIKGRYGSPSAAWSHEVSAGWY
jgi:Transglycosylase SLT domain